MLNEIVEELFHLSRIKHYSDSVPLILRRMVGSDCLYTLHRTKPVESVTSETRLSRCLGIFDLIVIGVGAMVGSGIYIMTGITAKEQTGPSILLSFLLAAVIVTLVAACFTELAAQLHKTGSTYLYLYLTVGELPAFIVGFCILVLGVFSGATNARAWSASVDFLFDGIISNLTESHVAQWNVGPPIAA
jgi:amino acid transporter